MLVPMNRFVPLCVVSLFVVALGACTNEPGAPQSTLAPQMTATPSTTPGEVVPLDLTFTDPQLLDAITIAGFVPIFDVSDAVKSQFSADLDDGTVSLVDVQGTTGGEYYSAIQESRFHLVCDQKVYASKTAPFAADMTAAGFAPFPDDGIPAGESGDYWVAFLMGGNTNPTDCTLTYTRNAAKDDSTGDDIPVYTTTVQLN